MQVSPLSMLILQISLLLAFPLVANLVFLRKVVTRAVCCGDRDKCPINSHQKPRYATARPGKKGNLQGRLIGDELPVVADGAQGAGVGCSRWWVGSGLMAREMDCSTLKSRIRTESTLGLTSSLEIVILSKVP